MPIEEHCLVQEKISYSLNGESSLTDHLSSTARREEADFLLDEALGQVKETSLVIDGDDSYSTSKRSMSALTVNHFRQALSQSGECPIYGAQEPTGLLRHDGSDNRH